MDTRGQKGIGLRHGAEGGLRPARFSLRTRLIVSLLLLAWLPLLLALPLQYRLVERNLSEHALVQLEQVSRVQQRRVNRELERLVDELALVASRTQMRISLDAFALSGELEHQRFVERILADAADSARNLLGAWIYDAEGRLVAEVGRVSSLPADRIFESLGLLDGNRIGPYWHDDDCEKMIWLGAELELEERLIGRLVLAIDTSSLQDLLDDFPYPEVIGQSHILLRRPDGVRCALSSSPPGSSRASGAVLPLDRLLEWSADLPPDQQMVRTPENDGSKLVMLPLTMEAGRLLIHSVPHLQTELRGVMLTGYGGIVILLLVLATAFSLVLSGWISAPLGQLTTAVDRVRDGRPMPRMEVRRWPRELLVLAKALRETVDQQRRFVSALRSEVRQRRAAQSQLLDLANTDDLTGLANRRYFIHRLDEYTKNPVGHAALLYLDLDRFKPVNDEHGHAVGDKVLKTVAERMLNAVRDHDLPARMGGDEFAVLLLEDDHPPEMEQIAERIETSIMQPITVDAIAVQVGCSIGKVALTPGLEMQEALNQADEAMYAIKVARKARSDQPGSSTST